MRISLHLGVPANVRPTCTPCNHRKYNMHGDEFEAAP